MQIEIWSDIVCPWCYVGEQRLTAALAQFAQRDEVDLVWRSFELDPSAPQLSEQRTVAMLSSKYGVSKERALAMEQQLAAVAQSEGIVITPDRVVVNSFDAHRLLQLARERGCQGPLLKRLFASYFAEQGVISDHDTLLGLATEAGIDQAEARSVLAGDAYAVEVRADERRAATLGIRGVPFFVVDSQYGVSGAQEPALLLDLLNQAWAASHPLTLRTQAVADSASCEDGSCDSLPDAAAEAEDNPARG